MTNKPLAGASAWQADVVRRICGVVSHDLNNLLGIVSNNAHLLQRRAQPEQLQASIESTLRAVKSASVLSLQLQRLARSPSPAQPDIEPAAFFGDVAPLLQMVLGRHAELRMVLDPGTSNIVADAQGLEMALVVLAFTARAGMTRQGQVTVRVRNADVDRISDPAPPAVLVTFGDDGRGLDEANVARAFEPQAGSGDGGEPGPLGLDQVRAFCEASGGTASLASTAGLGTTVSLRLPAG